MTLADRVLRALIDFENAKPRNQQLKLGPSELGSCREYVRNVMIGAPRQEADVWPTAAVVGTLMGEHVEDVLGNAWGVPTQVPVTATLPNGLQVSGHADIVLPEENAVVDIKTKDQLAGVEKEGALLDNCVQISVYALGLVQAGVLSEGATAHLLYIDRSGNQQYIHEVTLTWEEMVAYIDVCMDRLNDVIEAQEHIDNGEVEYARDLRDKTPPFCYSERVLCPFRDLCWKGSDSEWYPTNREITDPETVELVRSYAEVRDQQKAYESMRREKRERLVGVTGITPDGFVVTWPGDGRALYVTKVK